MASAFIMWAVLKKWEQNCDRIVEVFYADLVQTLY